MAFIDDASFSHSRQEFRDGQQRPINKEYYYIDFHATIDAIKYRIFRLTRHVEDLYKPSEEKKEYYCPRCRSRWTQLEVLSNIGYDGNFMCQTCDNVLKRDNQSTGDSAGHEKQSRLMSQLNSFLKLMQEIDSKDIPNNDFETAFSIAVPVLRNENINPVKASQSAETGMNPPSAVKGLTQIAAAPLEISLTTSSEKTAAEQAAETQRKAEIAAQNKIPIWHTNSTVTGETTNLGNKERERLASGGTVGLPKDEEEEKKSGNVLNDELAAYYAQMQQEKEKEAKEDREDDASSIGDDEDEFEDVGFATSGAATPLSANSTALNESKSGLANGGRKAQGSESGSSVPATETSTPADSFGLPAEDIEQPMAKKVKLQGLRNGTDDVESSTTNPPEKDSDEDEEADFEDV